MKINVEYIQSSNIKAMSWCNDKDWNCTVTFNNNSSYSYKLVPIDNFISVLRAKSIGSAFNDLIKKNYEVMVLNGTEQ